MQALYIGGPTAILTIGGLRLMTDPTLDPAGHSYPSGGGKIILEKAQSPATTDIGKIDVVLLSHDQHPDNLDTAGRALLQTVTHIYTTISGSQRLGGNSIGLSPWDSRTATAPDGSHKWPEVSATG
jgi:L-ascorbate metabolism protein UlaG (beta-lactamase superfamily)